MPPLLPPSAHLMSGPWTNYKLTVCQAGNGCTDVNCAPANIAACPITNLKPSTSYTVTVVAQKTGAADSLVGGPDTFTTDAPAPLVGSLTACKTDGDCQRTTGELCDTTQKKCYCPSPRGAKGHAHAHAVHVVHATMPTTLLFRFLRLRIKQECWQACFQASLCLLLPPRREANSWLWPLPTLPHPATPPTHPALLQPGARAPWASPSAAALARRAAMC